MSNTKRYFEIKQQIKELSEELKTLENEVYQEVFNEDGMELRTDYAKFKIVYVPKWKYSDELSEKESLFKEKLKLMKKKEELEGVAQKVSDGGQLRMSILK